MTTTGEVKPPEGVRKKARWRIVLAVAVSLFCAFTLVLNLVELSLGYVEIPSNLDKDGRAGFVVGYGAIVFLKIVLLFFCMHFLLKKK